MVQNRSGGASGEFVAQRRRLTLILVLLLLFGTLATSLGGFVVARKSVRRGLLSNELPLTGDSVYSEIQRDLLRPVSISAQMSHDTFLQDWIGSGEQNSPEVVRYLDEIQQRFGATTSFFVSDATRRYYHSSGILKEIDENDPADAWYFQARSMKTDYEINIDEDTANRSVTTAFINYKIRNSEGRLLGITGVGITLKTIAKQISNYEQTFDRRIYFVDSRGNVALSSAAMPPQIQRAKLSERPGISFIAAEILAGGTKPLKLSFHRGSADVLVNSRFIPELNWHLIVEQDASPAYQTLIHILSWSLLLGLIVSALAGTIMMLVVRAFQRRLEHVVSVDELTGALNRRAGQQVIRAMVVSAQDTKRPGALLVLDVDHFKAINDAFGHVIGDRVLRVCADTISAACRSTDSVIRWGGEEFVIGLPICDEKHANDIAESIRAQIEANWEGGVRSLPACTVSIGLATQHDGDDLDSLLARADAALYRAKSAGRNQVCGSEISSAIDVDAVSALVEIG